MTLRGLHVLLLTGTVALLVACTTARRTTFKVGHGDAGKFILSHAASHGATLNLHQSLPPITNGWTYKVDEYGVEIRLERNDYPNLEKLLRLSFGEPRPGPTATIDGGMLGVYRLTPRGGALQFGHNAGDAFVIIIRPLTEAESSELLIRALQHQADER